MKSKLEDHAEEIVRAYNANVPVVQIAADLGVTRATVYNWIARHGELVRRLKLRRRRAGR